MSELMKLRQYALGDILQIAKGVDILLTPEKAQSLIRYRRELLDEIYILRVELERIKPSNAWHHHIERAVQNAMDMWDMRGKVTGSQLAIPGKLQEEKPQLLVAHVADIYKQGSTITLTVEVDTFKWFGET